MKINNILQILLLFLCGYLSAQTVQIKIEDPNKNIKVVKFIIVNNDKIIKEFQTNDEGILSLDLKKLKNYKKYSFKIEFIDDLDAFFFEKDVLYDSVCLEKYGSFETKTACGNKFKYIEDFFKLKNQVTLYLGFINVAWNPNVDTKNKG